MTGKWLSVPAVLWAMDDAPDVPPELVSTLLAVARYAGEDGRAAYPSASTIAAITRKTERQAKRDLDRLEKRGLLLPGDKNAVKDIRADRRPKVRDLPMPRGDTQGQNGVTPRVVRGDTHDTPSTSHGVTPRVRRGDIQGPNGVSPMSPEEVLKTSRTANGAPLRGSAPVRYTQNTGFAQPHPACHHCGKPFPKQQWKGQELCADCQPTLSQAKASRSLDNLTRTAIGFVPEWAEAEDFEDCAQCGRNHWAGAPAGRARGPRLCEACRPAGRVIWPATR